MVIIKLYFAGLQFWLLSLSGHFSESFKRPFEGTEISSAASVGSIVIGLYSVLFAYDGWSAMPPFDTIKIILTLKFLSTGMGLDMQWKKYRSLKGYTIFQSVQSTPAFKCPYTTTRTIPRAMVTGLIVIAVSYILVNLSFFSVLSRDEIIGTEAVALVCPTLCNTYSYVDDGKQIFFCAYNIYSRLGKQ